MKKSDKINKKKFFCIIYFFDCFKLFSTFGHRQEKNLKQKSFKREVTKNALKT